jgi:hypothetical protein
VNAGVPGEVAQAGPAADVEPGPRDNAHPPTARLVIHAANRPELCARRWTLQRLAGWLIGRRRDREGLPLKLTVQDLQGRHVSTVEPAGSLTQLRVPPGTYVVKASTGSEQRTYTLTLAAGTSFELYVEPLQPWRFSPPTPS